MDRAWALAKASEGELSRREVADLVSVRGDDLAVEEAVAAADEARAGGGAAAGSQGSASSPADAPSGSAAGQATPTGFDGLRWDARTGTSGSSGDAPSAFLGGVRGLRPMELAELSKAAATLAAAGDSDLRCPGVGTLLSLVLRAADDRFDDARHLGATMRAAAGGARWPAAAGAVLSSRAPGVRRALADLAGARAAAVVLSSLADAAAGRAGGVHARSRPSRGAGATWQEEEAASAAHSIVETLVAAAAVARAAASPAFPLRHGDEARNATPGMDPDTVATAATAMARLAKLGLMAPTRGAAALTSMLRDAGATGGWPALEAAAVAQASGFLAHAAAQAASWTTGRPAREARDAVTGLAAELLRPGGALACLAGTGAPAPHGPVWPGGGARATDERRAASSLVYGASSLADAALQLADAAAPSAAKSLATAALSSSSAAVRALASGQPPRTGQQRGIVLWALGLRLSGLEAVSRGRGGEGKAHSADAGWEWRSDLLPTAAALSAEARAAQQGLRDEMAGGGADPAFETAASLCLAQASLARCAAALSALWERLPGDQGSREAVSAAGAETYAAWEAAARCLQRRCVMGAAGVRPGLPRDAAVRLADVASAAHAIRLIAGHGVAEADQAIARAVELATAELLATSARGKGLTSRAEAQGRARAAMGLPGPAVAAAEGSRGPKAAGCDVAHGLVRPGSPADVRSAALLVAGMAAVASIAARTADRPARPWLRHGRGDASLESGPGGVDAAAARPLAGHNGGSRGVVPSRMLAAACAASSSSLERLPLRTLVLPVSRLRASGTLHGPMAARVADAIAAAAGRSMGGPASDAGAFGVAAEALWELTAARCRPRALAEAVADAAVRHADAGTAPASDLVRAAEALLRVAPGNVALGDAAARALQAVSQLAGGGAPGALPLRSRALRCAALSGCDPATLVSLAAWVGSSPELVGGAAVPAPSALFRAAQRVMVQGNPDVAEQMWAAIGLPGGAVSASLGTLQQQRAAAGSALQSEVERIASRAGLATRREHRVELCRQEGWSGPCDTAGLAVRVDLALPRERVVIEVDGPSHFLPPADPMLWGSEPYAGAAVMSDEERRLGVLLGPRRGVDPTATPATVAAALAEAMPELERTLETTLRDASLRASGWGVVPLSLHDVMGGLAEGEDRFAASLAEQVAEASPR